MDQADHRSESPRNATRLDRMAGSRRRKRVAIASAVLASASSASLCNAFKPTSAPLACYATSSRPLYFEDSPKRGKRRSLAKKEGLEMVSFLEAPITTATEPPDRRRVKQTRVRRTSRVRTTRKVDLQPSYNDFYGFNVPTRSDLRSEDLAELPRTSAALSTRNAERTPPDIDSEILYENFLGAPAASHASNSVLDGYAPSKVNEVSSTAKTRAKDTHTEKKSGKRVTRIDSEKSLTITQSVENSTGAIDKTSKGPKKRSGKSSTMPGFSQDEELDDYITRVNLSRVPASRTLSRIVRSKSAKMKRRQTNSEMLYKNSAAVPDSLMEYAHEIHAIERVTPKQERELGTKTQEAMRLQKLHDELKIKYGRRPTDDEWCAAAGKINVFALKEAMQVGLEAKNQLVASNLRMVQRVVNMYIRNGLGSEYNAADLLQDGTVALIRAAEKFEPDRGFRFSTYAMYWIRSAVKRSQTGQSRIISIPIRIHETHKRVQKNESKLRKELGRSPTNEELAEACDISVLQLNKCRKAMSQATFSLDAEIQNSQKPNVAKMRKDTMYDIVSEKMDETEYDKSQRLLMKEHLITALKKYLSPHEVDLLMLRYGLMDDRALPRGMSGPLTIAELSKLVGLKPDKVRRIIINSQKQLKHLMKDWQCYDQFAV
ncbi:hypothetical protein THAOC_09141 [Thalassiosira oceanica]|uniref:RNA polymerase sigma-70 domain-containing protein n=1 Tax=Thalassiosira oceanica TaxID=159749 RepID=K0SXB1_THAOC|nr:hypothetical protein THAOC_09141 [Thalassiosira oceanica]|eukprot:EJK69584.1 hypothetical protein THAOC_09141 [Thalassiosira oceanica]